ncbi:hypothetical protein BH18GEM1_BH18GEM1_05740 [soil metagenome]
MRLIIRLLVLAALVPALYVASAAIHFPAVIWHRWHAPAESALMEIRALEARAEGRDWAPRYDWVPLSAISPHLGRAVLAAEDTRFYEHHGFDWEQIQEAWKANEEPGETLRGASTITQQTVKNLYLTPSRNVLRKLREALLTAWMELWLPKDRILELYLNIVELGPGIFGAEAASQAYFGRPAARLGREHAALLAATLPWPLAKNPASPTPGLRRRQRLVLNRMERWYGEARVVKDARETEDRRITAPDTVQAAPLELPSPPPSVIGEDEMNDSVPAEAPAGAAPADSEGATPDPAEAPEPAAG